MLKSKNSMTGAYGRTGGSFGPGLKFKGCLNLKRSCDEIIFLRMTYSVNFELRCKQKELLQEILEFGLSGAFPNISTALLFLNELSLR
jgi:hypothetical protein